MNKITKEIGNILEDELNNKRYEIQANGLTNEQLEEINKFSKV